MSSTIATALAVTGRGMVDGGLTAGSRGHGGLGLQPRVTRTVTLAEAPRDLICMHQGFLNPTNPASNPTEASPEQLHTRGRTRESYNGDSGADTALS